MPGPRSRRYAREFGVHSTVLASMTRKSSILSMRRRALQQNQKKSPRSRWAPLPQAGFLLTVAMARRCSREEQAHHELHHSALQLVMRGTLAYTHNEMPLCCMHLHFAQLLGAHHALHSQSARKIFLPTSHDHGTITI